MKEDFLTDEALNAVARKYGASVFQIMLAFTLREGGVAAIPKAASAAHVEENARAAELACAVTREDWAELDRVFWPPTAKMHLDMD
jgi:diketogulonate reductase-like aldo/keto reductase